MYHKLVQKDLVEMWNVKCEERLVLKAFGEEGTTASSVLQHRPTTEHVILRRLREHCEPTPVCYRMTRMEKLSGVTFCQVPSR